MLNSHQATRRHIQKEIISHSLHSITNYTITIYLFNSAHALLTKWQKYSQNTTIFISYEWVDQIAVYNYMFRSLSAIVRLSGDVSPQSANAITVYSQKELKFCRFSVPIQQIIHIPTNTKTRWHET